MWIVLKTTASCRQHWLAGRHHRPHRLLQSKNVLANSIILPLRQQPIRQQTPFLVHLFHRHDIGFGSYWWAPVLAPICTILISTMVNGRLKILFLSDLFLLFCQFWMEYFFLWEIGKAFFRDILNTKYPSITLN